MTELNPRISQFLHDLSVPRTDPTGDRGQRKRPLVWFSSGGEHYVVSVVAGSAWARGVRAAGGRVMLTHEQEQYPAQLTELTAIEGAALIRSHIQGRGPDGRPLVPADEVRRHLGIEPDALPGEIEAAAGGYAVFRIDAHQDSPPVGV